MRENSAFSAWCLNEKINFFSSVTSQFTEDNVSSSMSYPEDFSDEVSENTFEER